MLLRQHQEDQRIQIEEEDMEKIMSQGMGPSDIMDDRHEVGKAEHPSFAYPNTFLFLHMGSDFSESKHLLMLRFCKPSCQVSIAEV